MNTTLRVSLLAAVVLIACPLAAQDRVQTASDTVRANLAAARSDLRNLITAQEVYFADHGRYAPHLDSLKAFYLPSRGSSMRLTVARNAGFAAMVTRERLSGSCIIWVGLPESDRPRTSRDGLVSREAEPVCDPQPEMPSAARSPAFVRPPRR